MKVTKLTTVPAVDLLNIKYRAALQLHSILWM